MIKYRSQNQLSFEGFDTTFENQLNGNNRWVKLATLIPWDDLAKAKERMTWLALKLKPKSLRKVGLMPCSLL